uniref:Serpentine receptor class gamma n=1 Tax=Caenorhabditis tropicalis TaxID=1561998 RepID=A0A1I7TXR1_9PELO
MVVSCSENYSYLNSIEFTSIVYHCLTIVEVPIHVYVGYLILFKSPNSMKTVKWYMFNVHFWISLLDVSFSFLTAPYILFPTFSGYGSGFLMWLGVDPFVQTTLVIILTGTTVLSIAVLFENRYTIMDSSYGFWSHVRKSLLIIFQLAAVTYFIPFYYLLPDQTSGLEVIMEVFVRSYGKC